MSLITGISADWVLLVYAVYLPLLLVVYVVELFLIFQHRRTAFRSSFYRIFNVLSVTNILSCLLGCFAIRLPLYPTFNHLYASMMTSSVWLTAAYSGAYYLNCLSEFLDVIMAFNRFTALHFPIKHNQIWRNFQLPGITLCLLVAVAPVYWLLDDETAFVEVDDPSVGFSWYYLDAFTTGLEPLIWFNMVIVTIVANTISSLLYSACLVRLCFFSVTRNYKAERNLFLVGFLTMLFSLPYMTTMLLYYLNFSRPDQVPDYSLTNFFTFQLPWLTDLKYLTPAPMLLITNTSIRLSIKKMFSKDNKVIMSVSKNASQVTPPNLVKVTSGTP